MNHMPSNLGRPPARETAPVTIAVQSGPVRCPFGMNGIVALARDQASKPKQAKQAPWKIIIIIPIDVAGCYRRVGGASRLCRHADRGQQYSR